MDSVAQSIGWKSADWLSDVWLEGSRRCLEITGSVVPGGARVLDYGCGVGFLAVLLAEMGYRVAGIDLDVGQQPEAVESAFSAPWGTRQLERANPGFMGDCWRRSMDRYHVSFQSFDGTTIPFPDGSFEAVMAHAVLEHVKPDVLPRVIQEIKRVLTVGGLLLVFRTPRKGAYLEKLFRLPPLRKYAHQILYNESELMSLMTAEGFSLEYECVSDMFPAFPPRGMRYYNLAAPLITRLDSLLLRTPMRRFAHHMTMVFRKEAANDT